MPKQTTKVHHEALALKYEGKSYKEISKRLKGKLTAGTLHVYFGTDGLLYIPYLEYEARRNQEREKESVGIFKREVANASKVIINALAHSIRSSNHDRAVAYAEKILDRAGLSIVKKSEIDNKSSDEKQLSDAQLDEILKRMGLNPKTGLPSRKTAQG